MNSPENTPQLVPSELQLPDEPNRGFTLPEKYDARDWAEGDVSRHVFRPFDEVFPHIGDRAGAESLLWDSAAQKMVAELYAGEDVVLRFEQATDEQEPYPIDSPDDAPRSAMYMDCTVQVDERMRQAAIRAGKEHLFTIGLDGLASINDAAILDQLLEGRLREAIGAEVYKRREQAGRYYKAKLFEDLKPEWLAELKQVSEMFAIEESGQIINLVNFSEWKLTREQLRQLLNGVRTLADADKAGDASTYILRNIFIVPEDHVLLREVTGSDGEDGVQLHDGRALSSAVVLSDYLIKPAQEQLPLPQNVITLAAGKKPQGVMASGNNLAVVFMHELAHLAFRRREGEFAELICGEEPHTVIGDMNTSEDIAETAAGLHVGGEQAASIGPRHLQAMLGLWATSEMIGRREGPSFVVCREIPLDSPERFGMRAGNTMMYVTVRLRFESEDGLRVAPA